MKAIDIFYLKQDEHVKSCLLALREIILSQDGHITNEWKYGMPFFCYKKKMFCYLWLHKKYKHPYIGFVEGKLLNHDKLIIENRARMKIMLLDANKDLPIKTIEKILQQALNLYKSGTIQIKD
jgi:hypothetical protein